MSAVSLWSGSTWRYPLLLPDQFPGSGPWDVRVDLRPEPVHSQPEPLCVPGLWSSPREPRPSSLSAISTTRRYSSKMTWIRPVPCWDRALLTMRAPSLSLSLSLSQPTPEIFITTTYRPLINYTPATGSQWIINMPVISISPIDFCHSFEMDILNGIFLSLFLQTFWSIIDRGRAEVTSRANTAAAISL